MLIILKHNGIHGGGDREVALTFGLSLAAERRQCIHSQKRSRYAQGLEAGFHFF